MPKLIALISGNNSLQTTYEYLDLIKNIWMILFSVGHCAVYLQTNLKPELFNVLNMKNCSAEAILRLQKEFLYG